MTISNKDNVNIQVTITCVDNNKSLRIALVELDCISNKVMETFKIIDIKIDDLFAKGSKSAALFLGNTTLDLLQKFVDDGTGFDNREAVTGLDDINSLMYDRANKNDPEAISYIATNYLNESVAKYDESLLELAETWFKKAADTGHKDSQSFYLDTWPNIKEIYRKRILSKGE